MFISNANQGENLMSKGQVFNKVIAMVLVIVLVIGFAPAYRIAAVEQSSVYQPIESVTPDNNFADNTDIAVSFYPGHFPAEAIVQDGDEDVVFSMYVTAELRSSDYLVPPTESRPDSPDYPYVDEPEYGDYPYDDESEYDNYTADYEPENYAPPYGEDFNYDNYHESDSGAEYYIADDAVPLAYATQYDILQKLGEFFEKLIEHQSGKAELLRYQDGVWHIEEYPDSNNRAERYIADDAVPLAYAPDSEFVGAELVEVELWWYQDGLRRTDKGVTYITVYNTYASAALIKAELRFDVITLECAGTWDLRAYVNSSVIRSPYTLNLIIEDYISIMPLSGPINFVNSPQTLADAWGYSGDITIILTGSFEMALQPTGSAFSALRVVAGRHVTIISDGLDNHTITAPLNQRHFIVNDGGTLTLGDANDRSFDNPYNNFTLQGQGIVPMANLGGGNSGGGSIALIGAARLNMHGGTIREARNTGGQGGGAVHMLGTSRFYMHGGILEDNITDTTSSGGGGAINLAAGTTFHMTGGIIRNNIASTNGGAISTPTSTTGGATVNIYGGEIYGNRANNATGSTNGGGGIYIQGVGAVLTMRGGAIHNNTALHGGGVRINPQSGAAITFNMHGGTIRNNTATATGGAGGGGGVHLGHLNVVFNMHGGSIINHNIAGGGAGIASTNSDSSGVTINLLGGNISGNTSDTMGGGVLLQGLNSTVTMSGSASICHNTANQGGGVRLNSPSAILNMHDNSEIYHNTATNTGTAGGGVHMAIGATINMYGGSIRRNATPGNGGGVANASSTSEGVTINMSSGEIFGNTASGIAAAGGGGGLFLQGAGTVLTMSGNAAISGNTAVRGGGIRFNSPNATLNMHGGEISGNTATNTGTSGGGIHLGNNVTFNMSGGSIRNNTTVGDGGGITNASSTTVGVTINLQGGEIYNNTAGGSLGGGGILLQGLDTMTISGTVIRGNRASHGGGIRINSADRTVNMTGGEIIGNTSIATGSTSIGGGGILMFAPNSTLHMSGNAAIRNNNSLNGGGVTFNDVNAVLDMSGDSKISDNTSTSASIEHGGGGVLLRGANSNIAMSGNAGIRGNRAVNGGGVHIVRASTNSELIMNENSEISGNISTSTAILGGGGGVMLQGTSSMLTMRDNAGIRGNTAVRGGGIRVNAPATGPATINMYGGEFSGNTGTNRGTSGGGIHLHLHATLNMHPGSSINNNITPEGNGAGVSSSSNASEGVIINMYGGEIRANRAYGALGGGGVLLQGAASVLTMNTGAVIRDNTALNGGGVRMHADVLPGASAPGAILDMNGGIIEGNTALSTGTAGGGVHMHIDSTLNVRNGSIIRNNFANGNGGGVTSSATTATRPTGATFNFYDGQIYNNRAAGTAGGGGVFLQGNSTLTMHDNAVIRNNHALHGGGVRVNNGVTFNMNGGEIHHNTTSAIIDGITLSGRGAGVLAAQTDFNFNGGTIRNNTAGTHGGGISVEGGGNLIMQSGASVSDNTAATNAGGIHMPTGLITMHTGSTVSGNTAGNAGGGIWLGAGTATTGARLHISPGATISNNTATRGDGGGIFTSSFEYLWVLSGPGIYPNLLPRDSAAWAGTVFGNTVLNSDLIPSPLAPRPNNHAIVPFGYLLTNHQINWRYPVEIYDITFDLNGGNVGGDYENITHEIPQLMEIGIHNVPTPVRADARFVGWRYEGQAANTPNLTNEDIAEIIVSEHHTFIAQWIDNPERVTFVFDDGTGDGELEEEIFYIERGTHINISDIPVRERPGVTLRGWQLNGAGPILTPEQISLTSITGEMRFVAVWGVRYNVTFNLAGGTAGASGNTDTQIVYYGYRAIEPTPPPTREGFDFDGWYTIDGYRWDFDDPVVESMTLTAGWTEFITIRFEIGHGGVAAGDERWEEFIVRRGAAFPTPTLDTTPLAAYDSMGWSPSLPTTATSEGTFTYLFEVVAFDIMFVIGDGGLDVGATETIRVRRGEPIPQSTLNTAALAAYDSAGWTPAIPLTPTENATFTYMFNLVTFEVRLEVGIGGVAAGDYVEFTVRRGDAIPAHGLNLTALTAYDVVGWTPALPTAVTADGEFTFEFNLVTFDVRLEVGTGGVAAGDYVEFTVRRGDAIPAHDLNLTALTAYDAVGWNPVLPTAVTEAGEFTFEFNLVTFDVRLEVGTGGVAAGDYVEFTVRRGDAIPAHGLNLTALTAYDAVGWSPALPTAVTADGTFVYEFNLVTFEVRLEVGTGGVDAGDYVEFTVRRGDAFPTPTLNTTPLTAYDSLGWNGTFPITVTANSEWMYLFSLVEFDIRFEIGTGGVDAGEYEVFTIRRGDAFPAPTLNTTTLTAYDSLGWNGTFPASVETASTWTYLFNLVEFTIRFEIGFDGISEYIEFTARRGDVFTIGAENVPAFTRPGQVHIGWQIDGIGTTFTSAEIAEMTAITDMRFVAVWTQQDSEVPRVPGTPGAWIPVPPPNETDGEADGESFGGEGPGPGGTYIWLWDVEQPLKDWEGVHLAYLIGFADGSIRPGAEITRAQIATIFFRLMDFSDREHYWNQDNPFTDVTRTSWHNNAISTTWNAGIFSGMSDGTFMPDRAITRAELAAATVRFMGVARNNGAPLFSDIDDHWARGYINAAANNGWLRGDDGLGGEVRPDAAMTRAEAVALINRAFRRMPGHTPDFEGMRTWMDNADANAWYYLYIQEATNSSFFVMDDDGIHTTWVGLFRVDMEWELLERPNSRPADIRGFAE